MAHLAGAQRRGLDGAQLWCWPRLVLVARVQIPVPVPVPSIDVGGNATTAAITAANDPAGPDGGTEDVEGDEEEGEIVEEEDEEEEDKDDASLLAAIVVGLEDFCGSLKVVVLDFCCVSFSEEELSESEEMDEDEEDEETLRRFLFLMRFLFRGGC